MEQTNPKYAAYIQILREELAPAMGCTEPIAIAYGAAKGREVLGKLPDQITVEASGNIIKMSKVWWSLIPAGSAVLRRRPPPVRWPVRPACC